MNTISFRLILILGTLLPFHAFLTTLAATYLFSSTQDSLAMGSFLFAAWKEIILFMLLILNIKKIGNVIKNNFKWTQLDTALAAFVILHGIFAVWQIATDTTGITQLIWGLRTNLIGYGAFWIIRLIGITDTQFKTIVQTLIVATTVSFTMGIAQLTLPCEDLQVFGYTPYTSSWVADKPLPCGHATGSSMSTIRVMGTFSGPNQFASFLLLTLPLIYLAYRKHWFSAWASAAFFASHILMLLLTFSRGAWLGALGAFGIIWGMQQKHSWKSIGVIVSAGIIAIIGIIFVSGSDRLTATLEHVHKPIEGIHRFIAQPLGAGVGVAGPVSLRYPPDGSAGRIAENWYIQIAEETGVVGALLMLWILITIVRSFSNVRSFCQNDPTKALQFSFIAICINSLFLHTWSNDSITTIVFWMLFGMLYSYQFDQSDEPLSAPSSQKTTQTR